MEMQPSPKKTFRVWGQALYRLKGITYGKTTESYRLLFAISDEDQQWLGWYYFGGGDSMDFVVLASPKPADHEVVAQFSGHFSLLHTNTLMTVEELAGPILWSQRGKWKVPKASAPGFRPASIWMPDHAQTNDFIDLHMTLRHDTGVYRFPIKTKKVAGFSGHGIESDFSERGYLTFIMMEPFQYPTAHLDSARRLRIFRHNLTTG